MNNPLEEGRQCALRGKPPHNPYNLSEGLAWATGFMKGQTERQTAQFSGDLKELQTLIGKKVVDVWIDPNGEGSYLLELEDGRVATFTSSGDFMTTTSFSIEEKGDKGKK